MCLLSAHINGTFGSPQKVLHPFFTALAKNELKIAEDILKVKKALQPYTCFTVTSSSNSNSRKCLKQYKTCQTE